MPTVLCLLGPPGLRSQDCVRPLELRPKALALLAYLLLVEKPAPRNRIAELLFPDAADPRDSLRWHLSYLRRQLPDVLVVDGHAVSAAFPTDVELFRQGAELILSDPATPDAAGTLALYRGDLCAGFSVDASADFHNWFFVEEDRLRTLFRRATVAFAHHATRTGRAAEVLSSVQLLTDIDPYLEDGHILLIEASELTGDQARARGAYDRYQRIVRTELHAEPRREIARRYEARQPAGRALPIDALVPLRDVTMHIVEWPGEGPAIIAIPGSAGQAYRLMALGEVLAPAVRLIAVSLRGQGFSDKPPRGYTVEDHVGDLLQLISALSLSKPILLGHSLGGSIATFAAEAARDDIGGLILFDAVVGDAAFVEAASLVLEDIGPQLERRFVSIDEYLAFWTDEDIDARWARWLQRGERMSAAPLPDGTYRRRTLRDALADEWASVASKDSLRALSRVTAPVLVVHADGPAWFDRPYLDVDTVQAQIAAARDVTLCIAQGQNHADIVLRPSRDLVNAVVAFAKSIRAKNAGVRDPGVTRKG